MKQHSPIFKAIRIVTAMGLTGLLSISLADEKTGERAAQSRAHEATDKLTKSERESQMPLPGQGYSHSSLLLDKAKDKQAVDEKLDELEKKGKIKK